MKVLLVSPLPPPVGGIARWTQIMLASLTNKNGFDVVHINSSPKYCGKITNLKRIFYGAISLLSVVFSVYRQLKNIDVVHITSSGSLALYRDYFILKIAKKYGKSTVIHLHFGRLPELSNKNNLEWKTFVKVFSFCDVIIPIDRETENTLKCRGFSSKTIFCPNPIDTASLKRKDNSTKKKNNIVFIGHIYREKGVDELVKAWIDLSKAYPEYSLVFIGSTFEKDFINSLPKDDSIHFIGEKTHGETMELLSEATMLVLPSYSEGFPNVILEAMALKVPIIATRVGAIPEMLDGRCGLLIDPKSTEQLRNAISTLIEDPTLRCEVSNNAYQKLITQYDSSVSVKKYIDIWEMINNE